MDPDRKVLLICENLLRHSHWPAAAVSRSKHLVQILNQPERFETQQQLVFQALLLLPKCRAHPAVKDVLLLPVSGSERLWYDRQMLPVNMPAAVVHLTVLASLLTVAVCSGELFGFLSCEPTGLTRSGLSFTWSSCKLMQIDANRKHCSTRGRFRKLAWCCNFFL